ncbi:MAG: SIR2 family protein [Candidatus Dormibacteraeota bacterium]|nr:SIR2 family protein [Candidatus Dormibacteraeota bacterium]
MALRSTARHDPVLALAVNVEANPGVYAVLLGSGVSRPAGIPTGWEVVEALCRKLAGPDASGDPAAWYRERYGESPQYDVLLDRLTSTPAERQALLKEFFEPTPEEREQRMKMPTDAHRAIATLVEGGYVRFIGTTNFDRLMEQALADEGVVPQVIGSIDALKGAAPYAHSSCTILKIHGDYLDARIRNTTAELGAYEPAMDAYLERVLDDFGLIVCGWSASDPALVAAILRAPNRRYGMYWSTRGGELPPTAKQVTASRAAVVIAGYDANQFFTKLEHTVTALREMRQEDPTSTGVAVALLERYLPDAAKHVRLDHLMLEECDRLRQVWAELNTDWGEEISNESVARREQLYAAMSERPAHLLAALARHVRDVQQVGYAVPLLRATMTGAYARPSGGFYEPWLDFAAYPALLTFYSGGLIALDRLLFPFEEKDSRIPALLLAQLLGLRVQDRWNEVNVSVLDLLNNYRVFGKLHQHLPNNVNQNLLYPGSNLLRQRVQPLVLPYLAGNDYETRFDQFEYLMGLAHQDAESGWAVTGEFVFRRIGRMAAPGVIDELRVALDDGAGQRLVEAGLFKSRERLVSAGEAFAESIRASAGRGYL